MMTRARKRKLVAVSAVTFLAGGCQLLAGVRDVGPYPDAGSGNSSQTTSTSTSSTTTTTTTTTTTSSSGGGGEPGDAGCDANLSDDPMNCGECGHTCLGSTCVSSLCQPTILVSGQSQPAAIAADGTNVYWVDQDNPGTVMQCAVSDCAGTTITLASNQDYPSAIAVSPTTVFWITQSTLMACPVGGCGGEPTQLVGGFPFAVAVHPDGKHIVWTDSANGTVKMCNTVGASCTGTSVTLASGLVSPAGVAVDEENVYFTDEKAGIVGQAPLAGGTTVTLAKDLLKPLGIAVQAPALYFVQYLGGSVNSVPIGGGMTSTIATAQMSPGSVAADSLDVYWVDSRMTGTVARCPRSGCANGPIVIAAGDLPYAVALDEKRVYWVDYGSGTVSWVAKY